MDAMRPVSVLDVAAYVLKKQGEMTAMKLQKLVYYSQAWSLVWDEQPLFTEHIEAWANGPVVPHLYREHQGRFTVTAVSGDPSVLDEEQRRTVDVVLDAYGGRSAHELSQLTHDEPPWLSARRGLSAGQRGSETISHAAMAEYYGSL